MSHEAVIIKINDKEFEAVVEFTPDHASAAILSLAPEDCCEAESEDIIIHSLHMLINICGIDTKQDVSFLIDELLNDIKEQLKND
tara:strand:+ start:1894 stop:2148 length:255 start_codon:yes stop_codon:yes gene_type:complete